jgi:hypothetical protein
MLIGEDPDLSAKDLQAFTYPSNIEIENVKLRGLYLGNYVRWDAQKQIEDIIAKYGYESAPQERTFNTYETIYCAANAGVHDFTKYLKYGFGKATDHVCRDIRLNRMSREKGIALINKYDHKIPQSLSTLLNWLDITKEQFYNSIDPFRDLNIWGKDSNGTWELKDSIINHVDDPGIEDVRLPVNDPRNYIETELLEPHLFNDDFILMGRSYMDEFNFKAIEG